MKLKLMEGKKAQMGLLKNLIIFLVVTIVLFSFIGMTIPFFKELSDKASCKLSVAAKFGASTAKFSEADVKLQCYTQKLVIKDDGIYKTGRDRKERRVDKLDPKGEEERVEKILATQRDKVKKAIVNEIYDCWDQFYEGKLNMYGPGFLNLISDQRCIICSEIIFDKTWMDANPGLSLAGVGLSSYISDTKIPGTERTFKDYFGGDFSDEHGQPLVIMPFVKNIVMFQAQEATKLAAVAGAVSACVGLPYVPFHPAGFVTAAASKVGKAAAQKAAQAMAQRASAIALKTAAKKVASEAAEAAAKRVAIAAAKTAVKSIGLKAGAKALSFAGGPLLGCGTGLLIGYFAGDIATVDFKATLIIGPAEQEMQKCDRLY